MRCEIGFVREFNLWGKVVWDGKFWAKVKFNVATFKEGKSVERYVYGRCKDYAGMWMIEVLGFLV